MDLKFVVKLLGLSLIIGVATAAYLYWNNNAEQYWFWGALVFYSILGLLIGWRSHKAVLSESNSAFFTGVMGGTGLRMVFATIFLAIYLIVSTIKAPEFIVYYLFLYLFYSIFEISQLVHKLRAEKRSSIEDATS